MVTWSDIYKEADWTNLFDDDPLLPEPGIGFCYNAYHRLMLFYSDCRGWGSYGCLGSGSRCKTLFQQLHIQNSSKRALCLRPTRLQGYLWSGVT